MEQLELFAVRVDDTPEALVESLIAKIDGLELDSKVALLNEVRLQLHNISPFKAEPVDLIQWVKADGVKANDYNPNAVAPPEMELLRHSIGHDGYTQPVVTWANEEGREVIDGFHRTRVAKECQDVMDRVLGYLPVVTVKDDCTDRNDRIASTIRHNRARGKHKVDSMSDIVVELKKRNWSDKRIAKELGMDPDEILRLCQVSGLAELFQDQEFSESWDVGIFDEEEAQADIVGDVDQDVNDNGRIYHTWDKWECYDAGFHGTRPPKGMSNEEAEEQYRALLSDADRFRSILDCVIDEWKYSCEHNLTNDSMNRIAWLGQAALAYELGIPACFRGGYNLLTAPQQQEADAVALDALNKWLEANGRDTVEVADTAKTEVNKY
jgi:ParB-like chromosome segregation protein Spo0J